MTFITINGRALIEPQIQALRSAIAMAHDGAAIPCDPDRLAEVSQMFSAPVSERKAQERVLTQMHQQRVERALQLAGIVPESASPKARGLAEGYVLAGARNDEAAVRLQRALEE